MSQPPFPQRSAPSRPAGSHASYETRREAAAALAAGRELGPEYSDQVAEGLADRVEQIAALRTAELRYAAERNVDTGSLERTAMRQRFVISIISLGAGIPITAIAATHGGLIETAICWGGIVGVNLAQAFSGRRRP